MVESTSNNIPENKDNQSGKNQCDIVVLGHVNLGKSTLCGRILLDFGMVTEREIAKLKKEAIDNNMESWYLAYIMD